MTGPRRIPISPKRAIPPRVEKKTKRGWRLILVEEYCLSCSQPRRQKIKLVSLARHFLKRA